MFYILQKTACMVVNPIMVDNFASFFKCMIVGRTIYLAGQGLNYHFYSICPTQSNLNSSNTDGPFTIANSNSFLSPYKIQTGF